jgi:hypothetical protein
MVSYVVVRSYSGCNKTLTNKLLNLKNNSVIYENGKSKEVYVYIILKDHIDSNY